MLTPHVLRAGQKASTCTKINNSGRWCAALLPPFSPRLVSSSSPFRTWLSTAAPAHHPTTQRPVSLRIYLSRHPHPSAPIRSISPQVSPVLSVQHVAIASRQLDASPHSFESSCRRIISPYPWITVPSCLIAAPSSSHLLAASFSPFPCAAPFAAVAAHSGRPFSARAALRLNPGLLLVLVTLRSTIQGS